MVIMIKKGSVEGYAQGLYFVYSVTDCHVPPVILPFF
jgi:hypothetical protein